MNDLTPENRISTKELAEILNVTVRVINKHAADMFPEIVRNGVATYLNQEQATAIKQRIERSGRNDLEQVFQVGNITTDLEMFQKIHEVVSWSATKIQALQATIEEQRPKVEMANALMESHGNESIGVVAKTLGYGRNKFFQMLRRDGILDDHNTPYQRFIDEGYFVVRIKVAPNGENVPVTLATPRGLEYLSRRYYRKVIV